MTNIEMIEFIDEFLRDQEDVLHGIEGRDCTKSRKYLDMIKKQLSIHVVVKPLPSFLYEDDGKIYTGVRGDADITKNWEKYIGAKNTERLLYIDKYLK